MINVLKSYDSTYIFNRWTKVCSIKLGFAVHLSPHANICIIALITIQYLYNNYSYYD